VDNDGGIVARELERIGDGSSNPKHLADSLQALVVAGRATPSETAAHMLIQNKPTHTFLKRFRFLYGCDLDTFVLPLRVWDEISNKIVVVDMPVLLPWEIFAEMYRAGPIFPHFCFNDSALVDPHRACREFWEAIGASKHYPRHPLTTDPILKFWLEYFVPLNWHSDAGEVFNDRKYTIYHFCSALQHSLSTDDAKMLYLMLEEKLVITETHEDVAEFVSWNNDVFISGKIPYDDHLRRPLTGRRAKKAGEALAGIWHACFSGWQGDLLEMVCRGLYIN